MMRRDGPEIAVELDYPTALLGAFLSRNTWARVSDAETAKFIEDRSESE
jgi:hypothetical protein